MKSRTNIIIKRIANYGLFREESPLYMSVVEVNGDCFDILSFS